jgi:dTDP-4-dehydrorhamnose reductase
MNKLIVTGAGGLLGSNFVETLKKRFSILAVDRSNLVWFQGAKSICADILDEAVMARIIREYSPQAVIHCAAETRVDFCEEHPENAFRINEEGTRIVAETAGRCKAKIVYISTDSIFDGKRGMYNEQDIPHPINVYAQSKLAGEKAVVSGCSDYLVIRTNIFGWNLQPMLTLAEWILQNINDGNRIPGFTDVIFSPLLVNDLARIIENMLNAGMRGFYHVGARDSCSKFEFARMIARVFGKDETSVFESCSEDAGFKAQRPKDSSLDVARVTEALGVQMPGINEGLNRFRGLLDEGFVEHLRSNRLPGEV